MESSYSELTDSLENETDKEKDVDVRILKRNLAEAFNETSPPKRPRKAVKNGDYMDVYLRLRPFTATEIDSGENQACFHVEDNHILLAHCPKEAQNFKKGKRGATKNQQRFTFSRVFNETSTQKDLFEGTIVSKLRAFLSGQNCLVFTFGVTNSGKTHTIQGTANDSGILPRTFDVLFNTINGRVLAGYLLKPKMFSDVEKLTENRQELEKLTKDMLFSNQQFEEADATCTSESSGLGSNVSLDSLQSKDFLSQGSSQESTLAPPLDFEQRIRDSMALPLEGHSHRISFSVWVSFAEIYNEQIFDLLVAPPKKKKNARRPVLQLKDDSKGLPYVRGLKEICVHSADEAVRVLTVGKRNLQFAATRLNHNSSRSHCVFTIKLVQVAETKDPKYARISMLSFCDLAGTERYSKTHSFGDRIKEAGNINTSMLTLGRCMAALRDNQRRSEHNKQIVPFRDSKLTRLFQNFFCGQGRASMIVNINQCASVFDETLHALKYSAIAKEVVIVQEEPVKPNAKKKEKRGVVSMALAGPRAGPSRATVGWASPATLAVCAEEENTQSSATSGTSSEQDTQANNNTDVAHANNKTCANCVKYLEAVQRQQKFIEEMNLKLQVQERDLRKELCEEFSKQLVMMEEEHKKQIERTIQMQEDRTDERCDLYIRSVKKQLKRKRIALEDEENHMHNSTESLSKRKEVEKELESAKDRIERLEKELLHAHNLNSTLQEKTTRLSFEYTVIEKRLKDVEAQDSSSKQADLLASSRDRVESLENKLRSRDSLIEDLEYEVDTLKEDLVQREKTMELIGEKLQQQGISLDDFEDAE